MSAVTSAPPGLNAAGRAAWKRAMDSLTEPEREQFADVVAAYANEVDLAHRLRAAWVKLGRPADHELVRSMRAADRTVAHLARNLRLTPQTAAGSGTVKPGRPVGAVSAPDRVARQRFRRVK